MLKRILNFIFFRVFRQGSLHQDHEQRILQRLRMSHSPQEICTIAKFLARSSGSIFCLPVLMARLKDNDPAYSPTIAAGLEYMFSCVPPPDRQTMSHYFDPEWWAINWVGSNGRLVSYAETMAVAVLGKESTSEERDRFCNRLIAELKTDIAPARTYSELKLTVSDWELDVDIRLMLHKTNQHLTLEPLLREAAIARSPETIAEENLIHMKNDYLLTRLGIAERFAENHHLLFVAGELNKES